MIDFKEYFSPLEDDLYQKSSNWQSTQLGSLIASHNLNLFPEYKFCEIAIFNVNEYEGTDNIAAKNDCKIRKELYDLHFDNPPRICDLGYLSLAENRKDSFRTLELVSKHLIENGIFPIIIGGGHDLTYAVYKAYSSLEKSITLTTVDSKFDLGLKDEKISNISFFSKILEAKPNNLFHYSNIGYQTLFIR